MAVERTKAESRVLLLAPTTRDGQASHELLASARIECVICDDLHELCVQIIDGTAAIIVPEEVVFSEEALRLSAMINQQPVWSDLPVLVLSRGGVESPAVQTALSTLGNVSLIERPVRVSTLLSVVRAALRARERQYQVRDHIAQREQAENEVRKARDQAEGASRAKDQFLAVLSHELRTPLSPVVMILNSLQDHSELPEQVRQDIDMVVRNVELETKLIDDLLDVSRAINGKLRLRTEPVLAHDLLQHAIEICHPDFEQKRLTIRFEPSASNDCVQGDAARLEQVFWNLLKNAVKFTPTGGHITVQTRDAPDGRIEIQVIDNGVGIPQQVIPNLFNAFQQGGESVTHRFGGLGLGLAISKAVVDLHGGTIRAHSEGHGKGSEFIVELSTIDKPNCQRARQSQRRDQNDQHLLRLLLVEDHVDTARALSRLLATTGYSVKVASGVSDALALADQNTFDLVVSDIGLPDGSGYELMERIRDRYGTKGIAVSGYGMEADIVRGRQAGFLDHIVKPINIGQLQAVIQRVAMHS